MKRVIRKTETFDTLELFTAISRQEGYRIDVPRDIAAFQQKIGDSLKASLDNPIIIYGNRTQAMFAHVLGAMGMCQYIKQEDCGTAFSTTDDFQAPDYRVVTSNGDLLLIEVKNFHMKNFESRFTMKKSSLNKLVAYSEINKVPLKIAIYFSTMNKWVLLSPDSFFDDAQYIYIDFSHAVARNEMSIFGDAMLATLPPLRIEFIGDSEKIAEDGTVIFTIREVKMSCAGKPIIDKNEQKLAFYLMRYGDWSKIEPLIAVDSGRLISLAYKMEPKNHSEEQQFQFIGDFSSMVSAAFRELTVIDKQTGVVGACDVKYDPEFFSLKISRDYKSETLPIWGFTIACNMASMCNGLQLK